MSLVYPLKVNKGTSRYHSGPRWYLVDATDTLLASSDDPARANLYSEMADLTTKLVNGESIDIEVAQATTTTLTVKP